MAEIPIEKKSSKTWIWILLAAVLLGLLLWWLLADNNDDAVVTEPVAVEQTAEVATAAPEMAGTMTIASILANPSDYYGREGFTGEVAVGGPLTDRGFWIENDGSRMLAIIIDEPREVPLDINPGQTLRISGGTIRNPADVENLPGVPMDQDTINAMQGQEAVLVVDESNIEIVEGA
ncbi:hypothetical protein [Qipengyuania sp.]|uniref:hypothetical protein n=1 Tax=Qipengyuania sp. TaxID=2004515 RepID=UPI0035C86B6C